MTTQRLKYLVDINRSALDEGTDPDYDFRYLDIGAVGRGVLIAEPETITFGQAPSRARRIVRVGDTIISTVRTYLRAVWPVERDAENLIVSTGFAVLSPRPDVDPGYLGWLVQSDPVVETVVSRSVGVSYPAINASEIGNIQVPIPALPKQRAMADYLDAETAQIDALIEKKKLIVLDLEMRLSVLAYQLTTASGRVLPLRRIVRHVKTGTTPPTDVMDRLRDGLIPWYSPGDVGDWLELDKPSRTLDIEALREGWTPRFPANSTLVVGIGATAGRVAHLDHDATGNQQMTCIVAAPGTLPRFLSWQMYARTEELRATAPFTTLPILNNDFLRSVELVAPDYENQISVVQHLDSEALRTRCLTRLVAEQIKLLAERRQALINATVTGETEVPGVAA